ncbi:GntR family transcriptional regulator [Pseudomonas schmalbachii]|uniref:GntR family transcriptional regulator n=1 Tax=Pseudomonas schmalbachii TaxID=2816993 RepID=A0ABS3TTN7_9PSED|nr:GntR family transcriptional regulator [Pseudomonas schmalbachii]MBO3277021.1 GntR family transcriptional regulator [Pseudomonas schmalbachii]
MPALPPSHDPIEDAVLGAPAPRHVDLARTLMQDIRNGQPPIGGLLPTEAELCAKWGLSRYTVRQAIQKLCALGLVTRQAGVGTRVVANRPQSKYTQSMDALTDLARYAKGTTFQLTVREQIEAGPDQVELLRCEAGTPWLHLGGVRLNSNESREPIALVDIYVDAAFADLPKIGKHMNVPVYNLIEERYGIRMTRVEQELQGVLIDGATAEALQVPAGSPGLRAIRTYFVGDRVVEVTTGIHPASRFSYSMTFQLERPAG